MKRTNVNHPLKHKSKTSETLDESIRPTSSQTNNTIRNDTTPRALSSLVP